MLIAAWVHMRVAGWKARALCPNCDLSRAAAAVLPVQKLWRHYGLQKFTAYAPRHLLPRYDVNAPAVAVLFQTIGMLLSALILAVLRHQQNRAVLFSVPRNLLATCRAVMLKLAGNRLHAVQRCCSGDLHRF